MSFRGKNSGSNTIQVWNGTRWVPLNNLILSDVGSDSFLSTPNVSTDKFSVLSQNIQVPTGSYLKLSNDVVLGAGTADAGPTTTNDSVVIGKNALTSLAAPNVLVGSVLIGEQVARDNNSGMQSTTAVGYGIAPSRGAPFQNDTLIGFGVAGSDTTSHTSRVMIGSGAGSSGGGQSCVIIGANAAPIATGAGTTIIIGPGIATNLTGSSSGILIGAPPTPGTDPFVGLSGFGNATAISTSNAFSAVSSLSGVHIGDNSHNGGSTHGLFGVTITTGSFNGGSLAVSSIVQALAEYSFNNAQITSNLQGFGYNLASDVSGIVASDTLVGENVFNASSLTGLQSVVAVGRNISSPLGLSLASMQLFGDTLAVPAGITSDYSTFQNVLVRQGTTKLALGPTGAAVQNSINAQTASTAVYRGTPGVGVGDSQAVLDLISQGVSNTGNAGIFVGNRNPNTASMASTVGDLYINSSTGQLWQCTVAGTPGTWVQFSSGGGTPTWAQVLAAGNQTGGVGTNPTLNGTDYYTGTGAVYMRSATNTNNPARVFSGDNAVGGTGDAQLYTGSAPSGASGLVEVHSGASALTSGYLYLYTGNTSAASSGEVKLYSGNATVANNSGTVEIYSGTTATGTTGAVSIASGVPSGSGTSGSASLSSGQALNGSSGVVTVNVGNALAQAGNLQIHGGYCATVGLTASTIEVFAGDDASAAGGPGTKVAGDVLIRAGSVPTHPTNPAANVVIEPGFSTSNPASFAQNGKVYLRFASPAQNMAIFSRLTNFDTASNGAYLRKNAAGTSLEYADGGGTATSRVLPITANPAPSATFLNSAETVYLCNVNGGAFSITLPSGCVAGTKVVVKDSYNGGTQANANNITVSASGGETIDGTASYVISADLGAVTLLKGAAPLSGWQVI